MSGKDSREKFSCLAVPADVAVTVRIVCKQNFLQANFSEQDLECWLDQKLWSSQCFVFQEALTDCRRQKAIDESVTAQFLSVVPY